MNDRLIADTVCSVPFLSMSLRNSGSFRLCCAAIEREILKNDGSAFIAGRDSVASAWNSDDIKQIRLDLAAGKKPEYCSSCWKKEEIGHRSRRQTENKRYSEEIKGIIEKSVAAGGVVDNQVHYFELRLGSFCNLKCRTCGPHASTSWLSELTANKDDPLISSSTYYSHFLQEDFPRVNNKEQYAACLAVIEENQTGLKELRILGGEPLIHPGFLPLLKKLIHQGLAKNINLLIVTNLTFVSDEMLATLSEFKEIRLAASIDAIGARAELIRSQSRWEKIDKNWQRVLRYQPKLRLYVNCTVSALSIFSIEETVQYVKQTSLEAGRNDVHFCAARVFEPDVFTLAALPLEMRLACKDKVLGVLKRTDLSAHERSDFEALTRLLGEPEKLNNSLLTKKLYNNIETFDRIRKENTFEIIPELSALRGGQSLFSEKFIDV
jgi:organic radical activating enzyme